jgi:peptidoglycan/xylan/chitin deacetylase (PgdA/CDA1 family)
VSGGVWFRVGVVVALTVAMAVGSATVAPAPSRQAVALECSLPTSLVGRDVEVIPTSRRVVALTFDAGASPSGLPKIRRVLNERNVKATFFLTGSFTQRYPVRARNVAREHVLGNHTQTHPDLTTLTNLEVRQEIMRAQRTIVGITGENPRPYFRFPFGARDARTIRVVNNRCYVAVRWTVDTLGWQGTSGGRSVSSVVERVRQGLRPGAIILMHVGANPYDGSTLDADALGRIITLVRAQGYRPVTLGALLPQAP